MQAIQIVSSHTDAKFSPRLRIVTMCAMIALMAGCTTTTVKKAPVAVQESTHDSFDTAVNLPPSAQTLYSMGRILGTQGRDAECEAIFRRIVREHPQFVPAYSSLAEVLLRNRRADDAIDTLSTGLSVSPRDPVLLNDIGMCYMVKQLYYDALRNFTKAASASPSDARYRANMAAALGLLGRYDESLALYLQILPADESHYNLGVLCQARMDRGRAAEEFHRAEQLRAKMGMEDAGLPAGHDLQAAPDHSSTGSSHDAG